MEPASSQEQISADLSLGYTTLATLVRYPSVRAFSYRPPIRGLTVGHKIRRQRQKPVDRVDTFYQPKSAFPIQFTYKTSNIYRFEATTTMYCLI